VGTPDHNNWLPPAFASYEPHHDPGVQRADSSLQRPPHRMDQAHREPNPSNPQSYGTRRPAAPHIINQAPMYLRTGGDGPYIMPATSGDRCNTFDESWSGCVLRRLSESEKSEIWDGFEGGESLRSISRPLKRPPSTIRTHLVSAGFRRPLPAGDWSSLRLSLTEREEISRGLAVGETMRCIATRLERAPSPVSREVAANGGRHRYRAAGGHRASRHRARRPKPGKLATNHRLRGWLRRSWRRGGHLPRYRSG